jgi:hypothetical protein
MVTLLPPLIQAYRRRYPDVELQLSHMNPDDQFRAFDEGRLDLGFSRPVPVDRRPYFNEEMIYNDYLSLIQVRSAFAPFGQILFKVQPWKPFWKSCVRKNPPCENRSSASLNKVSLLASNRIGGELIR